MKILVCGATGCIGRAVTLALRSRGHRVVEGARGLVDGPSSMPIDFMTPRTPTEWSRRLSEHGIEGVVNCVGILMPMRGQTFERVHAAGPVELFRGASLAGVRRIVQISALGVGADAAGVATPYLRSKLVADEALASLGGEGDLDWAVLRPSLVYGPGSQSAALFATLASLPVVGLPGGGRQLVQPVQVVELAEIVARLLEREGPTRAVMPIGGGEVLSYRAMLMRYRTSLGLGDALWLPVPMPLMKLGAWLAEALPQRVFSRDTMRLLERGNVAVPNHAPSVLGRPATGMAQGLAIAPPRAWFELRAELSPALAWALRGALAVLWLYTAAISALLQEASGVLELLARCGFEGRAGQAALVASCALNAALGVALLWRPSPWVHAIQAAAIVGYTVTAAVCMPELTIDHCGPLVKNLPVLVAALLLWLDAQRSAPGRHVLQGRREAARPPRQAQPRVRRHLCDADRGRA